MSAGISIQKLKCCKNDSLFSFSTFQSETRRAPRSSLCTGLVVFVCLINIGDWCHKTMKIYRLSQNLIPSTLKLLHNSFLTLIQYPPCQVMYPKHNSFKQVSPNYSRTEFDQRYGRIPVPSVASRCPVKETWLFCLFTRGRHLSLPFLGFSGSQGQLWTDTKSWNSDTWEPSPVLKCSNIIE